MATSYHIALNKAVCILCVNYDADLTTGTKAYWTVPKMLHNYRLVEVGAHVYTASTSGNVEFDIIKVGGVTTKITIDATETDSLTATTPAVIDGTNNNVEEGLALEFSCALAGTGAKGMEIRMEFRKEA